ncbi:MAG: hypothetical protein OER86_09650 [Phycisphaerae bacterium]|nr:hypothetical protein [Phycisphaerae bacterium]
MALVDSYRIGSAVVLALVASIGCQSAGGIQPADGITSSIVSGTRKMTRYGIVHDVDIQVRVVGRGARFGVLQVSDLSLSSATMARDKDFWTNPNSDGWPQRYEVEAIYSPSVGTSGQVIVTVTVEDLLYSGIDRTVHSATHLIEWDRVKRPAPGELGRR